MGYCPWGCRKSDMTEATEHEQNLRSDIPFQGASVALVVKNLSANAEDIMRHRFNPWVGKIPWRRAWQPITVFLPGEFHGQRSLASTWILLYLDFFF